MMRALGLTLAIASPDMGYHQGAGVVIVPKDAGAEPVDGLPGTLRFR